MKKMTIFLAFLLFVGFQAAAQMQITGTVTDAENGSTIPGVSVVVKGNTSIGTTTDLDGNYSLSVPENSEALIFSFVGMQTIEEQIAGRSIINVEMVSDVLEMDEVIVVAYGTTKKSSFTGSAATVKTDKLEKLSTTSVSSALQGNAPGVQVVSTTGQPGENATIRIRGIGSINASSDPLYVVDGVPYQGNINSINPSDIESMSVLKDANATALYGSRGANGVIMITTKTGTIGDAKVNFKASYGISSKAVEDYETVGAEDYYKMTWTAIRNKAEADGRDNPELWATENIVPTLVYNPFNVDQPIGTDGEIIDGAELLWDTDWMDEVLSTGDRQEYLFDIGGGDETTNYYMSLGYLLNEGIVPVSDFERFNARVNLDKQVTDWFKAGINFSGSTSDQNYPTTEGTSYSNMIQFGRNMASIYPVYLRNDDGTFITDGNGDKIYDYGMNDDEDGRPARPTDAYPNTNVLGGAELDNQLYERDNVSLRTYGEFDIVEGLKFKTNFSYDYYIYSQHEYANPYYGYARSYGGISYKSRNRTEAFTLNNILTYEKSFGDHNFNALAGHEAYQYNYHFLYTSRSAFPFGGLEELDAAAATQSSRSYKLDHRVEGYLARLEYNYAGRYYISGSYRRDGSSRFHPDYRWGNFWSVGGSWRISEEEFINLDWMTNLKLKASYGTLGNDQLLTPGGAANYYAYQGLYETGYDNLTDAGLLVYKLANEQISWEVSKIANIGIEIGLLNRFNFEFDFFNRSVEDMLFARPLPNSTGVSSIDENVANMKNVGFDGTLNAALITNKDFSWLLDLNFTHYKNEITKMPEKSKDIITGSKKLSEGHSVYDFYIQEFAGVDEATGNSLWYKDVYETDGSGDIVYDDNGDPVVIDRETTDIYSEANRYYVGSSIPDFYGGITNTFSYKGFDLSVFVFYSVGGKIIDYDYQGLTHAGLRYGGNMSVDLLDAWTPENSSSDIPRLDANASNANARSSRYLVDASYLRLRNVTIGYTLPSDLASRIKMENVRLYVSGDNLYTLFGTQGLDPEVNIQGTTDNRYPQLKTFSFGVNLSF
ncbi:MAG: SusC/RagA family TonB-linked outer membrane protein [Thiohalospira sp.]